MVAALIPSDRLLEQSSGIKQLTTVLVIVCMIICTCTWVIPFESDDRNHQIYSASAAQSFQWKPYGSLSAKHKDEFGLLCDGVNDTVEHMKSLILDVQ